MQHQNERKCDRRIGNPTESSDHDRTAHELFRVNGNKILDVFDLLEAERESPTHPKADKKRNHQIASKERIANERLGKRINGKRNEGPLYPSHVPGGQFVVAELTPIKALKESAEHRREKQRKKHAHQGAEEGRYAIDFVCRRSVFLIFVVFRHRNRNKDA